MNENYFEVASRGLPTFLDRLYVRASDFLLRRAVFAFARRGGASIIVSSGADSPGSFSSAQVNSTETISIVVICLRTIWRIREPLVANYQKLTSLLLHYQTQAHKS